MALVTFLDKDNTLPTSDPKRLGRAVDLNEIKNVVNTNAAHLALTNNPHGVTKAQVGLTSVDDTSDADKPVSTAQQTAIDAKVVNAINNGATTTAPSQDAVFDALAGKETAGAADTVATNLSNHISDATDAHAGTAINNTAAGNISATTVQAAINELDTDKQATLVSGTNIKTVNGGTLLGSGDLTIAVTTFAENIIPTGTINGINLDFVLPSTPVAGSLKLYVDTGRMIGGGVDYTLSGVNITMGIAPVSGIVADYRT